MAGCSGSATASMAPGGSGAVCQSSSNSPCTQRCSTPYWVSVMDTFWRGLEPAGTPIASP